MPPNVVYVGRPTRYGNMFTLNDVLREQNDLQIQGVAYSVQRGWQNRAVEMYRTEMLTRQMADPVAFERFLEPLRGKDLACWCPIDQPCHGDVLLELLSV